jgi:DNA-binding NarL/FixJ family response regulator
MFVLRSRLTNCARAATMPPSSSLARVAARPFPAANRGPRETRTAAALLVVENHDEMRTALRDWLLASLPSLRLREARSLEEALQHAEQAPLDLVLVSLELPGANGIELTRELRRRFPALPVVLMSVTDSEAVRIAALEAGAASFVPKRELTAALAPLLQSLL